MFLFPIEVIGKMLKNFDVEMDKKDFYQKTPLDLAAESGKLQTVQFLVGHGSNPEGALTKLGNRGKEDVVEFLQMVESKGHLFPLHRSFLNYLTLADDISGFEVFINEASDSQKVCTALQY